MSERKERTYEMLWDCRFCGTKKLLGKTHRHCPNCGSAQDPSWRYYPSDDEKVAVEDHVYVGVDRICPACGALNAASAQFCTQCGSPLEKAQEAKKLAEQSKGEGEKFQTEDLSARQEKEKQAAAMGITASAAAKPKGGIGLRGIAIIAILVLVVGGILYALFATRPATAYVSGYRWEREISIESLQALPANSNCDSVPFDAYSIDRRYEQVGSRSVPDGETCRTVRRDNGDGTFSEREECETKYRDEPVYGYVCYYLINRWTYARKATASGDRNTSPAWPNANLRTGNCLGCERESGRDEKYFLIFKRDGDKTFECPVPFDQWQNTPLEKGFTVDVGRVLDNVRCNSLKPT